MKRILLCAGLMAIAAMPVYADSYWKSWEGKAVVSAGTQVLQPEQYRIFILDQEAMRGLLNSLQPGSRQTSIIQLPSPDGANRNFKIWNTPVLPEGLQSRYTTIRTFTATEEGNPAVTAKIDYTVHGFHAMVMDGENTYFIDPYSNKADGYYTVYYRKDYSRLPGYYMHCQQNDDGQLLTEGTEDIAGHPDLPPVLLKTSGNTRRTYRLALSCTGEYAEAVGGEAPTVEGVLSAMTTTMNRVNGIYEKEIAVTMQFIEEEDELIYLDPATDPFTANDDGSVLLGQNQGNTDDVIGSAGYDIGHIFSTGGGGIASLGSVCSAWGAKAQGVTGSASPMGDPFDVDYVAHEMGHQFGANHTFNRCSSEEASAAYEPGSGSTIMAYAGICGSNNLQRNSDPYFHTKSLDEITDFLVSSGSWGGGASCGSTSAGSVIVGLPDIAATYEIPYKTPFELTAPAATAGTDGAITYCWEQWNLGNLYQDDTASGRFTMGPSFRSFTPGMDRTRVFPRIDSLVKNTTSYMGERLPLVARQMKFKLVARELSGGWGTINIADNVVTVNVSNTGAPFKVTQPDATGIVWDAGVANTVNWNVAATNVAPVNTANVDIYLSVDGGFTYPYLLAAGVPNAGTATVTVPTSVLPTNKARIKVKGAGNIFFDISNNDFKINNPLGIADVNLEESIKLYPNPAENVLYLELSDAAASSPLGIAMYNAIGQIVWTGSARGNVAIPVAAMARGAYYVHIMNEKNGARVIRKLILQ